jgi:hypothetical protein
LAFYMQPRRGLRRYYRDIETREQSAGDYGW